MACQLELEFEIRDCTFVSVLTPELSPALYVRCPCFWKVIILKLWVAREAVGTTCNDTFLVGLGPNCVRSFDVTRPEKDLRSFLLQGTNVIDEVGRFPVINRSNFLQSGSVQASFPPDTGTTNDKVLEITEHLSIMLKHHCLRRVDAAEFMLSISGG